jgi:hypothetical protein
MEKYLSGQEIVSKYSLQPFQLLDLVQQGLEVYQPVTGIPVQAISLQQFELISLLNRSEVLEDSHVTAPVSENELREKISEIGEKLIANGVELPELNSGSYSDCLVLTPSLETTKILLICYYKESQLLSLLGMRSPLQDIVCSYPDLKEDVVDGKQFNGLQQNDERSPALNSNKVVAPELQIALDAYRSLFAEDGFNPRLSVKNNLRKWLKAHYPDLGEKARERIVTVANTRKNGGAPRQP